MKEKNKNSSAGFSLIEVLFAVAVLAIILTALLGTMLYTVNTINESRYRANAVAWASSCLDDFKRARATGWVRFASNTGEIHNVNCDGATITNGLVARRTVQTRIDGAAHDAGGNYCLRITPDFSSRSGANGRVKVTVQVGWLRFNDTLNCDNPNDFSDPNNVFTHKNRTATLEQIFFRFNDEQPIP
jgi:prepilin-type N-terminal cleavage/methylation domain-containing protein